MAVHYSDTQLKLVRDVAVSLNSISILACILILSSFIYLSIHHPTSSNRVTLRLTVVLALVDLIYSVFQIISDVVIGESFWCSFSVWGYVQFTLLSMFLTVALAFNLQAVFLSNIKDTTHYQKYYYGVPLVWSLLCATPAWIAGQYGWEATTQTCWYKYDGTGKSFLLQWGTMFAWVLATIVYCLVIVVLVWIKVLHEKRILQETAEFYGVKPKKRRKSNASYRSDTEKISEAAMREKEMEQAVTQRRRQAQLNLTRIVRRVAWYPLVPVITQTPNVAVAIAMYSTQHVPYGLLLLSYIGTSIQGLLHFIAFCFDPAVQDALDKWKVQEPIQEEKQRVRFDTVDVSSVEPLLLLTPDTSMKRSLKRSDTMDSVSKIPLPAFSAWRFSPELHPVYPDPVYGGGVSREAGRLTSGPMYSSDYYPSWSTPHSVSNHPPPVEEDEYWLHASMQIGMEMVEFPLNKTL